MQYIPGVLKTIYYFQIWEIFLVGADIDFIKNQMMPFLVEVPSCNGNTPGALETI